MSLDVPGQGDIQVETADMNGLTNSGLFLTGLVLIALLGGLPMSSFADAGYQSATSVRVGNRHGGDHPDRYRSHNRGGYPHRGTQSYGYYRPHGYSARPHYYVIPRHRSYYEPRYYYDRRHSGWDVDFRYYFSD